MYPLSDKQIDYILDDISARGVEMESLQQNLLDHICCIIEQNLEANGDFESFYQKTIQTFYKDALWEIEEETILLLTFKNYYTMKKIMIISGTFSAAVMSLGILFKFMHWPGASACILLGIAISSLIFLPLLFTLKAKEKQNIKDKLILGLATASGILISFAVLFKIMRWPGANMMGLIFVGIMLVLYIPLYFFSGIKNPEAKINTIVTTIIMIMGCGLFLTLVNSKPQARYLNTTEIKMINDDDNYIKSQIDSLNLFPKDSLSTKWIKNVNQINTICNEVKSFLLVNEFGIEKFPDITDKDGLLFSTSTFNDYADRSNFCKEKFNQLNKLTLSHIINYIGCEYKLNLGKKAKRHPSFNSSILFYDSELYYYNNTILGSYKDLQEIQLKYIYETYDLISCKSGKF